MRSSDKLTTQRLIQITDCHLGGEPGEKLLGLDTDESLQDVLDLVVANESRMDLVVVSGDVASRGQAGAYHRFPELMQASLTAPLAWIPGNHDLGSRMRELAANVAMDCVELEHWQVVLLDSSVPGYEHGDISEAELKRLEDQLSNCHKHAVVFVHHQPVPVGSAWIDQYVIRNGERLLSILDRFSHMRCLVWGHVHQEYEGRHTRYAMLATPSTCIQFKPGSHDFALDDVMPGYRWFDLNADGSFSTAVERTPRKHYGIDFDSDGY